MPQHTKIFLFLIVCLFLGYLPVNAQRYNFKNYSVDDGVPRSGIYDIIQDQFGYIWIATEGGGIARYNGIGWKVYNVENGLSSNTIRCLFQDKDGFLWIGSQNGGLSRFDGRDFLNFSREDGFPGGHIRDIIQDEKGRLWIATMGHGVIVAHPDTLVDRKLKAESLAGGYTSPEQLPHKNSRVLLKDHKNDIWVGTDGGLVRFTANKTYFYTTEDGLPDNRILALHQDNMRNIRVGTQNGLALWNGDKFESTTTKDGLIHNRIRAINQDVSGNVWVGTRLGISRVSKEGVVNIDQNSGLSNSRIRKIFKDSFGNLWVGTYFGGINKFTNDAFITYTNSDGLSSNQITCVLSVSPDKLLVGTYEGLSFLNFDDSRVLPKVENYLNDEYIKTVTIAPDGTLWIAGSNALYWYDNGNISQLNTGTTFQKPEINSILIQNDSTFWVGTQRGIYKSEGVAPQNIGAEDFKPIALNNARMGSEVSTLFEDKYNQVWIGFKDGGLLLHNNDGFRQAFSDKIRRITSITADVHKNVWVGTEAGGIYFFNNLFDDKLKNEALHLTKDNGLASNSIYFLQFDVSGNLWVGNNLGVEKLKLANNFRIESKESYGSKSGLAAIESSENAIDIDKNGNVWIGTLNGVILHNQVHLPNLSIPPEIHITEVGVDNNFNWHKSTNVPRWFDKPDSLVLHPDDKQITIEFIGMHHTYSEQIQYRWMLEGLEKEFNLPGTNTAITYTNLPPGKYRFIVQASTDGENWNQAQKQFSFTVKPAFHQTVYFYIAIVLVLVLLVFGVIRIRTHALAAAKRRLESQVIRRTSELIEEKEKVETQNLEILQQAEEISTQRDILYQTNKELQRKNKDITDSINYAQRIQNAVLIPEEELKQILPQSFIFFQARDIVSGDFYWFHRTDQYQFVVAADCTGHGVPGAFMSVIGINLLEDIVSKRAIYKPDEILKEMDLGITRVLHQNTKESDNFDGLDMALCRVEYQEKELIFAGAFRPLVRVRKTDGQAQLDLYRGTKQGVGGEPEFKIYNQYKAMSLKYMPSDRFYIFSDGFSDQFGGPRDKKYSMSRFKRFLTSNAETPITTMREIVEQEFADWKRHHEQIDDILVMGFEL